MLHNMEEFSVGDVVRFKEWEEMIRDGCYEATQSGHKYLVPSDLSGAAFANGMRRFCGKQYVITEIDPDIPRGRIRGLEKYNSEQGDTNEDLDPARFWAIDPYMFVPSNCNCDFPEDEIEESDEMCGFLNEWE